METYESNGSSLIELCKSFLEMVCITVLTELGKAVPTYAPTTEYVVATLDSLGLKNTRGGAFDKVLSAHNRLADALTEVRNREGSVAHGKDAFIDNLSSQHARTYVLAADTVLSLILTAYDGTSPNLLHTREPHAKFRHLNARIDACTDIRAEVDDNGVLVVELSAGALAEGFNLRIPASELLYSIDRQAYVDVLDALGDIAIQTDVAEEQLEPEEGEGGETAEREPQREAMQGYRHPQRVDRYDGRYATHVNALYEHALQALSNVGAVNEFDVQNLTYTLLSGMEGLAVIDWSERESTRSAVRLLVKKSLRLLCAPAAEDDAAVEELVKWLANNIPGGRHD
ncbi:MAG: abortive infection family protein [Candidatus Coatesbacteria bacterium]|nr:abortive infection family protein [Candidatus Coatesbacteria bacterium]